MSNSGGFNRRRPAPGTPLNPRSTFSRGDGKNFIMSIGFSDSGKAIEKPNLFEIFIVETSIDEHAQTSPEDCADVLRTFFNLSAFDAEKLAGILVQKGQVCLPGSYTEDLAMTRTTNLNEAIKQGLYPDVTLVAYEAPATTSFGQIPRSP